MNTPDQLQCAWTTAGHAGLRCQCPATLSISQFCVFHRRPDQVDAIGIVQWSQDATAEEYLQRAKALLYQADPPAVREIRERMASRNLRTDATSQREPGQDE